MGQQPPHQPIKPIKTTNHPTKHMHHIEISDALSDDDLAELKIAANASGTTTQKLLDEAAKRLIARAKESSKTHETGAPVPC